MLKHKSFLYNLFHSCLSVLSPRRAKLLGGVLLVCALAFLPVPVSAYSTVINSDSSSFSGSIRHDLNLGCLMQSYDLKNGSSIYLGSTIDGVHNCGYRLYNRELQYWSPSNAFYLNSYNINTSTPSFSSHFPSDSLVHSYDFPEDFPITQRVHSFLSNITISAQNYSSTGDPKPILKTNMSINGSSMFAYRFDMISGVAGTTVELNSIGSNFKIYNSNGSEVSSEERLEIFKNINSTLDFSCGGFTFESLPDDSFNNFRSGLSNDSCWVIMNIPLSTNYYIEAYSLMFSPISSVDYNFEFKDNMAVEPYLFDFISISDSYFNVGVGNNQLKPSNQYFEWLSCTNTTECDKMIAAGSFNANKRQAIFDAYKELSIDKNSWNVFSGLSFLLPFEGLFNFTDSGCVDLPLIASWLKWPNSQYCSWWPENIKSTLDPVFDIFIVLFGFWFVFKWLNSKESLNVEGGA